MQRARAQVNPNALTQTSGQQTGHFPASQDQIQHNKLTNKTRQPEKPSFQSEGCKVFSLPHHSRVRLDPCSPRCFFEPLRVRTAGSKQRELDWASTLCMGPRLSDCPTWHHLRTSRSPHVSARNTLLMREQAKPLVSPNTMYVKRTHFRDHSNSPLLNNIDQPSPLSHRIFFLARVFASKVRTLS